MRWEAPSPVPRGRLRAPDRRASARVTGSAGPRVLGDPAADARWRPGGPDYSSAGSSCRLPVPAGHLFLSAAGWLGTVLSGTGDLAMARRVCLTGSRAARSRSSTCSPGSSSRAPTTAVGSGPGGSVPHRGGRAPRAADAAGIATPLHPLWRFGVRRVRRVLLRHVADDRRSFRSSFFHHRRHGCAVSRRGYGRLKE